MALAAERPGASPTGTLGSVSTGGGLWAAPGSTNRIYFSTISSNAAASVGAIRNAGGLVELDHALIQGSAGGEFMILGPALIEDVSSASLAGQTNWLTVGLDPLLGERQGVGGSVPVRRIKPLSPAVNAGDPQVTNPPLTDLRYAPRIQGGRIDIGAYELSSSTSFVAQAGADGTNECRDATAPCATIAHALAQALPDDEIQLLEGSVTNEEVSVEKSIRIRGIDASSSIWNAESSRHLTIRPGVTVLVADVTFSGGRATDGTSSEPASFGGSIFNEGVLWIERCRFEGNTAGSGGPAASDGGGGGAIYNNGMSRIRNTLFRGNRAGNAGAGGAGGPGGAIYNDSNLEIEESIFIANAAGDGDTGMDGGHGGAIYNAGLLLVSRSAFVSNAAGRGEAGGSGGAIYNSDTLGMTNVTLSENRAINGSGGGLANAGYAVLAHATIGRNLARNAGRFDHDGVSSLWSHVLVAENMASETSPDARGMIDSRGWNLIGDSFGLHLTNVLTGNLLHMPARLGSYFEREGLPFALGLLPDSPARDAGNPDFRPPPLTDQFGRVRYAAPSIDIGAVEMEELDTDGDGLPDYWEILYGLDPRDYGSTNASFGATGDPDGDGVSNAEEYIAGTSPVDPASVFRIIAIQSSPLHMQFTSVTGRLYTIQSATIGDYMSEWEDLGAWTHVRGTGGTISAELEVPAPMRVYRIAVWPE